MLDSTKEVIAKCLKFKGGRSRPDKSMPFIFPLLDKVRAKKTHTMSARLLDVGCGRGSFGLILQAEYEGRIFGVDGIEINREYEDSLHAASSAYRNIWIEDFVETYKDHSGFYDAYIFIDVLEHFRHDVAISIVKWLRQNRGVLIASIPVGEKHWHQSEEFEKANPFEAHRHNWTIDEVEQELGMKCEGEFDSIGVFQVGVE